MMSDGSFVNIHPRGETLDEHNESIAILSDPDADCFGTTIVSFLKSVCQGIDDHGTSIKTSPNEDALGYLHDSLPENGDHKKCIRAQKFLISHSLWLFDSETVLEEELDTAIGWQVRNLPPESQVLTWVNSSQDQQAIKSEITSMHPSIKVATQPDELETWIEGYIGWQVNPNGGAQTAIEWSHRASEAIERIG